MSDTALLEALIANRWVVSKSPHRLYGLMAYVCGCPHLPWPRCIAGTGDTEREAIADAVAKAAVVESNANANT